MTEQLASSIINQFNTLKTDLAVPDNERCQLFASQLNTLAHTVLRQEAVLKTMAAITQALGTGASLQELPQLVTGLIEQQLSCRQVKLLLPGINGDWPSQPGSDAPGRALSTGQPQSEPLPNQLLRLAVPLVGHTKIVGLLELQLDDTHFLADDSDGLLPLLAGQLASALENRQLVQQVQQELTDRNRAEENLLQVLQRTESLYRIGSVLATETNRQAAFEIVLTEHLRLLNLEPACGSIILFQHEHGYSKVAAQVIDGQPAETVLSFPATQDTVAAYLAQHRRPLAIEDVLRHPLTRNSPKLWQQDATIRALLFTPLISQDRVIGTVVAGSPHKGYKFAPERIELGQAISDQLAIWLENRQLLSETQYRSEQLRTAADVSRAASSILDVDKLINTSVNLIRDHFNFYYVGLFLLDDTGEWAVLRAGTGKAGRIQLARNHRLKVGGGSMIGWSIANRKARITLDVGEDAVHFRNPILPDTHSELALPLISREQPLGALTVQSVQSGAFTDEDVTLLQSLADQLANAIANAHLFESVAEAQQQAEQRLRQTQALQQLGQQLAATLDQNEILQVFLKACIAEIGFDYVQLALADSRRGVIASMGGIGLSQGYISGTVKPLDGHHILAEILRSGKTEIITGWDERLDRHLYEQEQQEEWVRLFTPVELRRQHVGVVEAGYNRGQKTNIADSQIEMLKAFISQAALALDNAQRFQASQRRAQREALIKEITTKVRSSTNLDAILQTTVKEIGDAIPSKRAYIQLKPATGPLKPAPPPDKEKRGRGTTHD
ncbi:MAG: hypothetical protein Kow0031_04150 [Anaerolineae bacterium]